MNDQFQPTRRRWSRKFADAFRGVWVVVCDNNSYWVHGLFAVATVAMAAALGVESWRWCVLALCITAVLATETLNTAMEELAKAIDDRFNPHVRDALDMGSAAVLIAALGAALVGLIVLLPPLWALLRP